MPKLKPTAEALSNIAKREVIVDPGDYRAQIVKHEDKPSKEGDSRNDILTFRGLDSPLSDAADILVYCTEKQPGRDTLVKIFEACGHKIEADEEYDPAALVDQVCIVTIINEKASWDKSNPHRITNKIANFLPVGE